MMTEGPDDDGVGYTSGTLADGRVGADVGGKVYGMLEPSVEIHPYVGAGKFVEHSPSLTVITRSHKKSAQLSSKHIRRMSQTFRNRQLNNSAQGCNTHETSHIRALVSSCVYR